TLSQSGSYVLTRDISATSGPAITIHSDNVVLDLNGRTVGSTSSAPLLLIDDGFKDITVRNGRLVGNAATSVGILYQPSANRTRVSFDHLEIVNAGIGIDVQSAESADVVACRISNATIGIIAKGHTDAFTGRFVGNAITGITTGSPTALVRGLEVDG